MWEDEKFALLPMLARLTFIGLLNFSDDYGVVRSNPAFLKSRIFPYDEALRASEFKGGLDALVSARMLVPLEYRGEGYYVVRTFRSHQIVDRPGKPNVPETELDVLMLERGYKLRQVEEGSKAAYWSQVEITEKAIDFEAFSDSATTRRTFDEHSTNDVRSLYDDSPLEKEREKEKETRTHVLTHAHTCEAVDDVFVSFKKKMKANRAFAEKSMMTYKIGSDDYSTAVDMFCLHLESEGKMPTSDNESLKHFRSWLPSFVSRELPLLKQTPTDASTQRPVARSFAAKGRTLDTASIDYTQESL